MSKAVFAYLSNRITDLKTSRRRRSTVDYRLAGEPAPEPPEAGTCKGSLSSRSPQTEARSAGEGFLRHTFSKALVDPTPRG